MFSVQLKSFVIQMLQVLGPWSSVLGEVIDTQSSCILNNLLLAACY